jgi:ATP-binding cassette subfamily B (MDR/TAP) protein 1
LTSGRRPQFVASDDSLAERLQPHRSNLPLFFYLLSFAPGFSVNGFTSKRGGSWTESFSHPYVLYGVGTIAALLAGLAFPAFDILYGYWTTGITAAGATDGEITARGRQAGWIMAVVAFVIFVTTWAFPVCCE